MLSNNKEKSALIAMSGGVDSSVAAYLMQQRGFRCEGTTMRLYRNADIGLSQFHTCCSQRAVTVGQALVLYDGELVVGGGTISRVP